MALSNSVAAWGTPAFAVTFAAEVQALDPSQLPLQAGLAHSSHVSAETTLTVLVMETAATATQLQVNAGVFYSGVIAGSCCSDDPTPVCEQPEYCTLRFEIDRKTAIARVMLVDTDNA